MRVARQVPSATTGRLVCELKADGQNEGKHTFNKGLAIAKQLNVGRFILKINRDSRFSRVCRVLFRMGHPEVRWLWQLMTQDEGKAKQFQGDREGAVAPPLNSVECGISCSFLRQEQPKGVQTRFTVENGSAGS